MPCAKFLVNGKVQGVFFRASARSEALALGICGHANNLPDGRVEVLAWGDTDALNALETWLRRGPPLARVDEDRRTDLADPENSATSEQSAALRPNGFSIGAK